MTTVTVETSEHEKKLERPFPKPMISNKGRVIYFDRSGSGWVLKSPNIMDCFLHYCASWEMGEFKDYDHDITITISKED